MALCFKLMMHCFHIAKKKVNTIQYGYSERGTHARVFSQTLAHGNSKNEIRKRNSLVLFNFILIDEASAQVTDYFVSRKTEGAIQYGYWT